MTGKAIPLTLRKLRAIQEALNEKLAGEFDDDDPQRFEVALQWAQEQIEKRRSRR